MFLQVCWLQRLLKEGRCFRGFKPLSGRSAAKKTAHETAVGARFYSPAVFGSCLGLGELLGANQFIVFGLKSTIILAPVNAVSNLKSINPSRRNLSQLPITDEKQRWEESEKRREENRREEKRGEERRREEKRREEKRREEKRRRSEKRKSQTE